VLWGLTGAFGARFQGCCNFTVNGIELFLCWFFSSMVEFVENLSINVDKNYIFNPEQKNERKE